MKYILVVIFGVLLAAWISEQRKSNPPPELVSYKSLADPFYIALSESITNSHSLTDATPDVLAAREIFQACPATPNRDASLRLCGIFQSAAAETIAARSRLITHKRSASKVLGQSSESGAFFSSGVESRWREQIAALRTQASSEWARIASGIELPQELQGRARELLRGVRQRINKTRDLTEKCQDQQILILELLPDGAVARLYFRGAAGAEQRLLTGQKIFLQGAQGLAENETVTVSAYRNGIGNVTTRAGTISLEQWVFMKNALSAL